MQINNYLSQNNKSKEQALTHTYGINKNQATYKSGKRSANSTLTRI